MRFMHVLVGVTAAAAMVSGALATAQVADADAAAETSQPDKANNSSTTTELPDELFESGVIDEITVVVGADGRTAYEMEMERIEQMKSAIFAEMRLREREQEEIAWRQADPDLKNPESRIKWGYSPQAEQRMRRDNDFLYDLPIDGTQPASLFRVGF